jgi:hypothetical protein
MNEMKAPIAYKRSAMQETTNINPAAKETTPGRSKRAIQETITMNNPTPRGEVSEECELSIIM